MEMLKQTKYIMIQNAIIEDITNGVYKNGELLPSEYELIEKYSVSRITIRRAIDELHRLDYIEKSQGKRCIIKNNSKMQDLTNVRSYTEEILQKE